MKKLLLAGVLTLSVVYASEASLELEHAIKSPSSIEDNSGDMSAMKAAGNILHVKDSGIGIKNPKEVFNRHYKEYQRGIGIGLHIVQKLCDALHVKISLTSTLGVGSEFILDFRGLN